MTDPALRGRTVARPVGLSALALAVLLLPDTAFSFITEVPWEVMLLRMLTLAGVSLLATLPWLGQAETDVRKRLRRWSLPGVAATVVYLFSTDPFFLLMGFCLLIGAALDVWATRGAVAAESLRSRLTSREDSRG